MRAPTLIVDLTRCGMLRTIPHQFGRRKDDAACTWTKTDLNGTKTQTIFSTGEINNAKQHAAQFHAFYPVQLYRYGPRGLLLSVRVLFVRAPAGELGMIGRHRLFEKAAHRVRSMGCSFSGWTPGFIYIS